jgi:hypothetical protein
MKRSLGRVAVALAVVAAGAASALAANFQNPGDSKGAPAPAGAAAPAVVVGQSGFYPLAIGSEWRYEINGKTVVARVSKQEKMGGHAAGKVDSFLEDRLLSSEHIAVTKEGVFRVAFDGAVPTKPVMILKLPPKDGEVWAVETEISGSKIEGSARCDFEKVKVPAGEFDAYRVRGTYAVTAPDGKVSNPEFTFWFADGTGVVKLGTKSGGNDVILELQSFKKGE